MKKCLGLLATCMLLAFTGYAQTTDLIMKDNGSGTPIPTAEMYENSGLVGIGINNPSALLHIDKFGASATDFFSITRTTLVGSPPSVTSVQHPLFKITEDGFLGIGVATPGVLVHIRHLGFGTEGQPMSNPAILVEDENEQILLAFANAGSATDPGGLLIVRSRANLGSGDVVPAFSVMNAEEELLNFSVGGDGSVVLGMDISGSSSFENDAQLNIHDLDNHDYLVNVADFIGDTRWLSVRKTGEVGIGESGTTNTALTLFKDGGNTYLDLLAGTSYNKAIRFMSTSSSSQARHIITEASGDFVIDPGVSGGGGNDRLKITGDVQIGTDKPTTSTFINSTSGEHNLSVNGWIVSKKVMVQTTDWADKVFAADYTLKSLADVEAYISQHKHLPEIPSECEVLENGVDVGEMNKLLLQKVEELTLYVIDLQKQVDELKK